MEPLKLDREKNKKKKKSLLQLESGTSILCAGPTGAGKTHWTASLLRNVNDMYVEPPVKILYCYGIHQPLFDQLEKELPNFTQHAGIPTAKVLSELPPKVHNLLIMDDLFLEIVKSTEMCQLFTRGTHHDKRSVIFISQNVLQQGRMARTIALNTTYMVLFRQPRDIAQFTYIGRQMYPLHPHRFLEAYMDATNPTTNSAHGYLFVNNHAATPEAYRLATRIFPGEDPTFYQPL
jgi:hypothetical protein